MRGLMLLLLLTGTLAQQYPQIAFNLFGDVSISEFLNNNNLAISCMGIAALAAIGIQLALSRTKLLDQKQINVLSIALFLVMSLVAYYTGLYIMFIPFVGYLFITGMFIIIWLIHKGIKEMGFGWQSKVFIGGALILLGFLSLLIRFPEGSTTNFLTDWVALTLWLVGAGYLITGLAQGKDEEGWQFKMSPGTGLENLGNMSEISILDQSIKAIAKNIAKNPKAVYENIQNRINLIPGNTTEEKIKTIAEWINTGYVNFDNHKIKINSGAQMGLIINAIIQEELNKNDYTLDLSIFTANKELLNGLGNYLTGKKLTIKGDLI